MLAIAGKRAGLAASWRCVPASGRPATDAALAVLQDTIVRLKKQL
jgi:hypothetical protein